MLATFETEMLHTNNGNWLLPTSRMVKVGAGKNYIFPFNEIYYTRSNFLPYNNRYVIQTQQRATILSPHL